MSESFNYKHFLSGGLGGIVATSILHPLDLIKIRYTVSDGIAKRPKYSSMWNLMKSVWLKNGIKGLYSGVTPNVIGNGLSWGLYFYFYNSIKSYFNNGDPSKPLSFAQYLGCGVASGSCTLLVTNPIWIAKTRLCLQYETQQTAYRGMIHVITDIFHQQGVRGLYKGFLPGLVGTSHGTVQFLVYEKLKLWNAKRKQVNVTDKMSATEVVLMSALSKVVAASSTYPYQVVRNRLQEQHRAYAGMFDLIASTWRNEGWTGFYKGLGASLLRVVPACCITFYTYETTMQYLAHKPIISGKNVGS